MVEEGSNNGKPENKESSQKNSDQIKSLGRYLEELEKVRGKLKAGEIGVEEAKQSLQEISEISANLLVEQGAKETLQVIEAEKRVSKEAEESAQKPARQDEKEARQAREADEVTEAEVNQGIEEVNEAEVKPGAEKIIGVGLMQENEEAKQVQEIEDSVLFEGEINVILMQPNKIGRMKEFRNQLDQVHDLHLVMLYGSVVKGNTIVVSARKPLPLIKILREMPPVNQVKKVGNQIRVILKGESDSV
ncbi:hypothetical protein ACFLVJ_00360 [Chloroflexota bacterium]